METIRVELETMKQGFEEFRKEVRVDIAKLGGKIDTLAELSTDGKLKYEILQHEHTDNRHNIETLEKDFKEYKETIRDEIKTIRRYKNLSNIVIAIVSATAASILTFLIIEYLRSR